MNTTSTLGFALLGLLAREPQTGYQLAQRMRNPIGYFWQAGHSQIYPELARLEAAGLVQHEVVAQQARPNKKVYTISSAGRDALAAWVLSNDPAPPLRNDLLLKAFSVWVADRGAAADLFRREHQRHQAMLAEYQRIQAMIEADPKCDYRNVGSPDFAAYATLRRGVSHEREEAEWCRWLAEALEPGSADVAGSL